MELLLVTPKPRTHLTDREHEVVELLGEGLVPKEIASRLDISYWTVKAHLANARKRTGSTTNAQLVLRCRNRRARSAERAFA